MELTEVLRRRRMVRSFSGRPPASEALDSVLSSARRAPTAGNTDGWDVVVLEGRDKTMVYWEATTTADWRERSRRWPGLSRAPVVLCVFAHPEAYLDRYGAPDKSDSGLGPRDQGGGGGTEVWKVPFWFVDAGFAVLLMLLAATDAGLGGCFLGNFRGEAELRRALGVPSDHLYLGAVLIGEPGGEDPPSRSLAIERRGVSETFHRGRW
jgi:nitroreductase